MEKGLKQSSGRCLIIALGVLGVISLIYINSLLWRVVISAILNAYIIVFSLIPYLVHNHNKNE